MNKKAKEALLELLEDTAPTGLMLTDRTIHSRLKEILLLEEQEDHVAYQLFCYMTERGYTILADAEEQLSFNDPSEAFEYLKDVDGDLEFRFIKDGANTEWAHLIVGWVNKDEELSDYSPCDGEIENFFNKEVHNGE